MSDQCPEACKVRLKHIEQHQKDHTHDTLWEELRMKVSQRIFFWMMGIGVIVLLAVFGAIYQQGGVTLEKVQAAQIEQATIQQAIKNLSQNLKDHDDPSR